MPDRLSIPINNGGVFEAKTTTPIATPIASSSKPREVARTRRNGTNQTIFRPQRS